MQFGFQQCPYCGNKDGFVYVHGHYQCRRCHQNVMPCCSGEQAEEECQRQMPESTEKENNE